MGKSTVYKAPSLAYISQEMAAELIKDLEVSAALCRGLREELEALAAEGMAQLKALEVEDFTDVLEGLEIALRSCETHDQQPGRGTPNVLHIPRAIPCLK